MNPEITFTNQAGRALDDFVSKLNPSSVHILVDENTSSRVLPVLAAESQAVKRASVIAVKAGEQHKNLDSLSSIWSALSNSAATRRSLLVNVGGGVITDMGGFAASTFKRGIPFVNIPTTLLCAVDASVGGKTGVNFNSLKNEIGVIRQADFVIISTKFFRTLTSVDLLSGYAEMIKHAFLSSGKAARTLMEFDIADYNEDRLLDMLRDNIAVKSRYVLQDINDNGIRKSLNLGHTAAHAFESLALQRNAPIPHGYAVAFGLLVALILSKIKLDFPSAELHRYAQFVAERYGAFAFTCNDYPTLTAGMHHDKKNIDSASISYVLLKGYGDVAIDTPVTDDELSAALDIYRDMLHLP